MSNLTASDYRDLDALPKLTASDYDMLCTTPATEMVRWLVVQGCHSRDDWQDRFNQATQDLAVSFARYQALKEAAAAVAEITESSIFGDFASDEERFAGSPILPLILVAKDRVDECNYLVEVLKAVARNQGFIVHA